LGGSCRRPGGLECATPRVHSRRGAPLLARFIVRHFEPVFVGPDRPRRICPRGTALWSWTGAINGRAGPHTRPSAAAAYTERHRATEQYDGLTPPPPACTLQRCSVLRNIYSISFNFPARCYASAVVFAVVVCPSVCPSLGNFCFYS